MIYLDHAATSWPKPKPVLEEMCRFLKKFGANPGRSGHRLSIEAGRIIYEAREAIAEFFHAQNPLRVIFCHNATHAINMVLHGWLRPGDQVVTTSVEHNAVMRPLRALEKKGIQLWVVPCQKDSSLDIASLSSAITPETKLVVVTHASNVTGNVFPLEKIAQIAHKFQALLLVDAAQSAGIIPIDLEKAPVDFLAFTGHKSLLGPPGTGGLILGPNVDISQFQPILRGGTGSKSESEEQPDFLPDKLESGTPNGAGIAGLAASIRFLTKKGLSSIREEETRLLSLLLEGLFSIPSVSVYGTRDLSQKTGVVSFTMQGKSVSKIGEILDEEFGILCRVGLHCAPSAHKTIGTFPQGTVRLSLGYNTSKKDIQKTLQALEKIAKRKGKI